MSFYLVPEKYDYVPDQREIEAVKDNLYNMLGDIEIDYWESDKAQVVGFLNTGVREISCPVCGHVESFENPAAFGEMLFVQSAETIEFDMPCCGNTVNLAQIDLTPNTKFSRFAFEVTTAVELSSNQLESLSRLMGNRMLVVDIDNEEYEK